MTAESQALKSWANNFGVSVILTIQGIKWFGLLTWVIRSGGCYGLGSSESTECYSSPGFYECHAWNNE